MDPAPPCERPDCHDPATGYSIEVYWLSCDRHRSQPTPDHHRSAHRAATCPECRQYRQCERSGCVNLVVGPQSWCPYHIPPADPLWDNVQGAYRGV